MMTKGSTVPAKVSNSRARGASSNIGGSPVATVQKVVGKVFPGYLAAVEAGLSACATLFFSDLANPTALVFVGPAGTGKTTVASMFEDAVTNGDSWVYRSDQFSPASFVSHSANRTEAELGQIDLIPRITDHVLLTPDLSAIFRGPHEELIKRVSIITRVLDGQGFSSDSGVYGRRGYRGEYLFVWIGCTTPLPPNAWRTMADVGSRLMFCGLGTSGEQSVDELTEALIERNPYRERLQQCREAVHTCLSSLFEKYEKVRSVSGFDTPKSIASKLSHLAKLLAGLRNPPVQHEGDRPRPENPQRALAILHNLARGHALINGRMSLTENDLPMLAWIALSSMPAAPRAVLIALAAEPGAQVSVQQVAAAGSVTRHTAEDYMKTAQAMGLGEYRREGNGKASSLSVLPEWQPYVTGELGELLRQAVTWQCSGSAWAKRSNKQRNGDK